MVRLLFEAATARTPGAFVEDKTAGLAWHHRRVPDPLGEARARELTFRLAGLLDPGHARVLVGAKIVEVQPRAVHKGLVATAVARDAPTGGVLLAMGDDQTDEDLFAALPAGGVAVHVGPAPSRAPIRLANPGAARAWLGALAAAG